MSDRYNISLKMSGGMSARVAGPLSEDDANAKLESLRREHPDKKYVKTKEYVAPVRTW
jgi:hypothetical protein